MKSKVKRITAILLCFVLLAGLLCGCGERFKVSRLVTNYERACHSGEMEEILSCYDPSIVNPARSISKLLGVGAETLLNLVTPLLGVNLSDVELPDLSSLLDLLKTLELKPLSYEFSDKRTKCSVRVKCTIAILGSEQTFETTFHCVERDGKWYVTI